MDYSIQQYNNILLSLRKIQSENKMTQYFKTKIPKDMRLDIAVEFKNPKWCLWTIENDLDLEFIDTYEKRENENYHELNEILGYYC